MNSSNKTAFRHWCSAGLSLVLVLATAGLGCKDESKGAASSQAGSSTATTAKPAEAAVEKPSARATLEPWRPLLDEAGRAELRAGGLFIELGTADQHKYTRGGWRTGWGENKQSDSASAAQVDSSKSLLDVMVDAPVREIVFRARAPQSQTVMAYVGDTAVGKVELGTDWAMHRIALDDGAMPAGRHLLMMRFGQSSNPRAEFDWLWLAENAGVEPPVAGIRALPLPLGNNPKRALIAPTSRSYSFYLQPPEGASLVFDYGSDAGATFTVRAHVDGDKPKELFTSKSEEGWQEARVDLADFNGKAIRLELATTGAAGITGWAEPVLMIEPTNAQAAAIDRGKRPKNVILIVIDTVRADAFGPFGPENNPVQTPRYDGFADRGAVFVNAYNNENWTKPSVATTLSGMYPSTHTTKRDDSELPRDVELISQRLQGNGFATAGFVANGYVSNKFGFEKGWDYFRNYIRENRKSEAEYVYGDALAWLDEHKNQDKPFFLYIQPIDPHVVYAVDRPYTDLYFSGDYGGFLGPSIDANELAGLSSGKLKGASRDIDWVRAVYRGEVTYHDEHMGQFLDKVEESGLFDDTLIVITNDHGEEHDDHGKFGHGHSLYEEMIRAPLLMHYPPRFPAGARVNEIVENVDVAPTILDVLGLEPKEGAEGQSLLPMVEGKPVAQPSYAITEFLDGRRSVRVGNWKFMRSSSTWLHLYDVVADREEKNNRIDDSHIARRMCEVHLGEGLATPDKSKRLQDMATRRKFKASKAKISPEMRRQLEALGYFGDDAAGKGDDDDDEDE